MRKAQAVSLFFIVGVVLLISFGIFFYLRTAVDRQSSDISTNFETQKIQLASHIKDCIKEETKEAVNLYGLNYWSSKEEIEYYIESNLEECIDFEAFETAGLEIEREEIKTNTTKSGNYLEVKVEYPITLSNQISSAEIENFIYNMEISKEKYIANEDGYTKTDNIIELKDAGIKLEIAEGTLIEGEDNKISIETRGKNIVESYFDRGVSNTLYELGPDGASFSKPIKLSIGYDEDILPEGFAEDDLSIVYFDEDSGRWISLETELDKKNNIASANIEHFSTYSLAWIIEYQERFFTEGYDSEFCEDIKNDLESHIDGIMCSFMYYGGEDPRTPEVCKDKLNQKIFSKDVSDAIGKGTRGIVKEVFGTIDEYKTTYGHVQRLFFNRWYPSQFTDPRMWCLDNDEELSNCEQKLRDCILGDSLTGFQCEGITSIGHLYYQCRKKASVYERESPDEIIIEEDGTVQTFGPDTCQGYEEPSDKNGMCLSQVRCYDNIHLCYLFPTENPEEQECPPGRELTINWCPQGNNVRCCKRPEFVEQKEELDIQECLEELGGVVTAYYTPHASQFLGQDLTPHIKMQGSLIDKENNQLLYWGNGVVESTPLTEQFSRGVTKCGTNPTAHRTVAASPTRFEIKREDGGLRCGDKIYIEIPEITGWDGWYTVEDTGQKLGINQFDIYAGEGEPGLNIATGIGRRDAKITKFIEGCVVS